MTDTIFRQLTDFVDKWKIKCSNLGFRESQKMGNKIISHHKASNELKQCTR